MAASPAVGKGTASGSRRRARQRATLIMRSRVERIPPASSRRRTCRCSCPKPSSLQIRAHRGYSCLPTRVQRMRPPCSPSLRRGWLPGR
eukprot:6530696-Alexandrium_andersonii.AAC.1